MDLRSRATTLAVAGVVVATAAIAGIPRLLHAGEVLPGVVAADVELGGLDEDEARAELQAVATRRGDAPITLTFEDRTFEVRPASFGWGFDVDGVVERAMAVGRDGNFFSNTIRHLTAFATTEEVAAPGTLDDDLLEREVANLAAQVDQDPGTGALDINPETLEVVAVRPPRGLVVDVDATADLLRAAALTPGPDEAELPVTQTDPPVTLAQVEDAARRAEAAIAEPVRLFHDNVDVVLQPRDLAEMIMLRVDGDEVLLGADPLALERRFADHVEALERDAVDATFDVPRIPDVTLDAKDGVTWEPRPARLGIVPSTPGATFDADLAAAQLGDMLEEGQREAKVALRSVDAEYTTDDLEAMGIDTLLGTFTSYHSCCQARVHNIQTLADMVDGTIVEPGDQFSINQISGERTCGKGFRPAGMILNGEIVDSCGGGVSQFGTTTFNAAFFAGLQLDAWKAHSFYISRYPMGREATLNFPSPDIDVKFTNDTDTPLFVRTGHTGTSITVTIYGSSDVTKVEATRSGTYNPRGWTTQRRPNPDLPQGQEVRVQSGAGGFTVRVNRFVHRGDDVDEDEIITVYSPVREIIEYGTGEPRPQPSPSPSPQPSQSPSPQPSSSPSPQPSPSSSPSPQPSPSPTPQPEPSPSDPPPGDGGSDG